MKIFKRWTTGLVSRVDWMVSQVENQEALINSAVGEARKAAARAKVQLGRVRADGQKIRHKAEEQARAHETWRERARSCAATDEARALECLRRAKQAEKQAKVWGERLEEHTRVEQQLAKDVSQMDAKISALVEKRNLLRTRQSRAEALSTVRESDVPLGDDLDEVFDRWETRVVEAEYMGACELEEDPLETSFRDEESLDDLKAELEELQTKEDPS